jgi:molybdate transport system ATP-binding protein
MSLTAHVRTDVGPLALDVGIEVATGELVTVLGPNGAGKTSLLRALAGLLPLREGRVVLDGDVLEDAKENVYVPVRNRSVGFVFQDYLLFPHLSVIENVAFGLRARGVSRNEARSSAMNWLEDMGLAAYSDSKPGNLSGGQAQRVALARALVTRPRLLLLDEPLAALDVTARAEMRRNMVTHLRNFEGARLLVTHDPIEALSLADRVLVIEGGRVVQTGHADELRNRPRSDYVANLVGVNFFRGRASGTSVVLAAGEEITLAETHHGDVLAVVHPRAVSLFKERPDGTPRNVWPGTVEGMEGIHDRVRVRVGGRVPIVAEVTPAAVSSLALAEGVSVWVSIKATEFEVFPA